MIPLSLRLRNFMSYGDDVSPLDFSRFTTACLTGDNGHGKSTLLDAITWALWGETRAKNLDDVVRLGQDEAEVEFVFDLESERYRVLRKRSLKTRQSALELQGFDPAAQRYRPLSGASIRETEAKIVQLLHMNYDTFINSVFVLQGRADEFTTRQGNASASSARFSASQSTMHWKRGPGRTATRWTRRSKPSSSASPSCSRTWSGKKSLPLP